MDFLTLEAAKAYADSKGGVEVIPVTGLLTTTYNVYGIKIGNFVIIEYSGSSASNLDSSISFCRVSDDYKPENVNYVGIGIFGDSRFSYIRSSTEDGYTYFTAPSIGTVSSNRWGVLHIMYEIASE